MEARNITDMYREESVGMRFAWIVAELLAQQISQKDGFVFHAWNGDFKEPKNIISSILKRPSKPEIIGLYYTPTKLSKASGDLKACRLEPGHKEIPEITADTVDGSEITKNQRLDV